MSKNGQYFGECFCGEVEVRVTGTPLAAGYCHCSSCRQWSAAPVNAFTLWKPEAEAITRGAENVGSFRQRAKYCMGGTPTKWVNRSASTLRDVPAARASSPNVQS